MSRYFTHYWKNDTWDEYREAREGTPLVRTASNKFRSKGVEPSDFIYVVTVQQGKLFLLGRLEVAGILTREQAQERFGQDVWNAEDHAVGTHVTGTPMRFDGIVSDDIVQRLGFVTADGITKLTYRAPGHLDQQTLRGVRELTPDSAALLDQIIQQRDANVATDALNAVAQHDIEVVEVEWGFAEGKSSDVLVNKYERNAAARARAIAVHGTTCQACGFSFSKVYGSRGEGYIEVHHLRPIASYGGQVMVDPVKDMTVLCANCHRMVHRKPDEPLSLEDLRKLVAANHQ
jgi:hypothetical protein